jgi:hypothetical protein
MNIGAWGRLGHAAGGPQFDLATNMVVMPSDGEHHSRIPSHDAHLQIVHESGHWNRIHGSSIGVSLSLMKYASERIIADHLPSLDSSEKSALFNDRRAGNKIFSFKNPPPGRSDRFNLIRQMWLDSIAANWALYDMHTLGNLQWEFSAAIESALTDVLLWGEPLFSTETARLERRTPQVRLIDRDSFGAAAVNGEEITTRHIFECTSTIDELLSLGLDHINCPGSETDQVAQAMGWPVANEQLAELALKRLTDGEYGRPWRAYTRITGDTRFPQSAIMTLLLCDIALNPPLPPFLNLDESAEIRWLDIYPPIRFLRCSQAVSKLGVLPGLPGDDLLREYSDDLCHAAQITNPQDMNGLFMGEPVFSISEPFFSFPAPEVGSMEGDYITYLSWAQRKLWNLRQDSPTLLTFFGANGRAQARNGAEFILAEGTGAGWFTEPFQNYQGTYRSALQSEVSHQYLASLALYLTLHDLVAVPRADTRERLPTNLRDYRFWQETQTAVEELFGCTIWLSAERCCSARTRSMADAKNIATRASAVDRA